LTAVIDEPVTGMPAHPARTTRAADTRRSLRVVFIGVIETLEEEHENLIRITLKFTHNVLMLTISRSLGR